MGHSLSFKHAVFVCMLGCISARVLDLVDFDPSTPENDGTPEVSSKTSVIFPLSKRKMLVKDRMHPMYREMGLGKREMIGSIADFMDKRSPQKSPNNPYYGYIGLGKRLRGKLNPGYNYVGLGKRTTSRFNPAYGYLGLGKRKPATVNPVYGFLGLGKRSLNDHSDNDAVNVSERRLEDGVILEEEMKRGPARYNPGYGSIRLGKKSDIEETDENKEPISEYLDQTINSDQYLPYISVGAISNIKDFFQNLKYNIHSLETKGDEEDPELGTEFGDAGAFRTIREDPMCSLTGKCKGNEQNDVKDDPHFSTKLEHDYPRA